MGIFDKGVKKTNEGFFQKLSRAIVGKSKVDDSVLDAIEEALISSDMGVDTTLQIIDNLEERVEKDKFMSMKELTEMLREEIAKLLDVEGSEEVSHDSLPYDFSKKPYVILVVGVNGVGKTTTIGKLAAKLKAEGKNVVLGAADTFRAAAVEQLQIVNTVCFCQRCNFLCVKFCIVCVCNTVFQFIFCKVGKKTAHYLVCHFLIAHSRKFFHGNIQCWNGGRYK